MSNHESSNNNSLIDKIIILFIKGTTTEGIAAAITFFILTFIIFLFKIFDIHPFEGLTEILIGEIIALIFASLSRKFFGKKIRRYLFIKNAGKKFYEILKKNSVKDSFENQEKYQSLIEDVRVSSGSLVIVNISDDEAILIVKELFEWEVLGKKGWNKSFSLSLAHVQPGEPTWRNINGIALAIASARLGGVQASSILKAAREQFEQKPSTILLTDEVLFGGMDKTLSYSLKNYLAEITKTEGMYFPLPRRVCTAEYSPEIPKILTKENRLIDVIQTMTSVCNTARMIPEKDAPERHIVVSTLLTFEEEDFMVITAGNTNKRYAAIWGHTPIVFKHEEKMKWHGQQEYRPSSETENHWYLHSQLKKDGSRAIIHAHFADIIEKVQAKKEYLKVGDEMIPAITFDTKDYGTEKFGKTILPLFANSSFNAVIIVNHPGVWIVGKTTDDCMAKYNRIVEILS
jgi:hypothetical protein